MINSISWLQYALAIVILLTGYYSAIISIYYRTEIFSKLKGKKDTGGEPEPSPLNKSVLGEIKNTPHETSLSSEELRFTSDSSDHLTEVSH